MYKAALDYFEKGKFDKTLQLFEEIAPYYQGTVREDTILFYTADAHFRSRDYQLSSMEFDDFRRRFGRSPFVEEAEYKYAMGFYYMSPPANRDQTSTYMAITSINEYLQRYPQLAEEATVPHTSRRTAADAVRQIVHQRTDVLQDRPLQIGGRRPAECAQGVPRNTAPGRDTLPHREIVLRTGGQLGPCATNGPLPRYAGRILHVHFRISGERIPPRTRPVAENREGIPRQTPERSNRIRTSIPWTSRKITCPTTR